MVGKNMLGDKSGGGFYKKEKGGDGEKEILALDLKTLQYRAADEGSLREPGRRARTSRIPPSALVAVMNGTDKAAKFAEKVGLDTLAYASRRIPEIADDLVNIDRALRWGFAWDVGPFETWDAYGVKKGVERMKELGLKVAPWVEEMLKAGRQSFYAVENGVQTYWDIPGKKAKPVTENARRITVELLKRGNKKLDGNESATAWDMGDGVLLLEFHSKMNSIDDQIIAMMNKVARHRGEGLPRPGHRQRRLQLLGRRQPRRHPDGRRLRRDREREGRWCARFRRPTSACATRRSRW